MPIRFLQRRLRKLLSPSPRGRRTNHRNILSPVLCADPDLGILAFEFSQPARRAKFDHLLNAFFARGNVQE